MDLRVAPSSREAVSLTPLGRRGHYRHQIQSLAYVNLDQANGGVIRNLGDTGLAIQAVAPRERTYPSQKRRRQQPKLPQLTSRSSTRTFFSVRQPLFLSIYSVPTPAM